MCDFGQNGRKWNAKSIGFGAFLVVCTTPLAAGPTVEDLTRALRHRQSLIRTMEYDYKVKAIPTPPEGIKLLERFEREGTSRLSHSPITPERAAWWSRSGTWCRKGQKEADVFTVREMPFEQADDGQFIRSLGNDEQGVLRGSIKRSTDWKHRITPRSTLIFAMEEHLGKPLAERIIHASDNAIRELPGLDSPSYQVRFVDPEISNGSIELVFDDDFRIGFHAARVNLINGQPNVLSMSYELNSYQSFDDGSGELIWYPTTVRFIAYAGELPDGTPVPWKVEEWKISNVRINHDIPDERFVINFPPGCEVYDEVNGLGWIKQGADTPSPAPTPLRATKKTPAWNPWWIALGTANAALLAVIGWLMWRQRTSGTI